MQDGKVFQEFYCSTYGGGCGMYIRVRLSMEYDRIVEIVCPICGHQHRRAIRDGVIYEQGRDDGKIVEQIILTKSACSKEPISKQMAKTNSRDGVVIKSSKDLARDAVFMERWIELYGE